MARDVTLRLPRCIRSTEKYPLLEKRMRNVSCISLPVHFRGLGSPSRALGIAWNGKKFRLVLKISNLQNASCPEGASDLLKSTAADFPRPRGGGRHEAPGTQTCVKITCVRDQIENRSRTSDTLRSPRRTSGSGAQSLRPQTTTASSSLTNTNWEECYRWTRCYGRDWSSLQEWKLLSKYFLQVFFLSMWRIMLGCGLDGWDRD